MCVLRETGERERERKNKRKKEGRDGGDGWRQERERERGGSAGPLRVVRACTFTSTRSTCAVAREAERHVRTAKKESNIYNFTLSDA